MHLKPVLDNLIGCEQKAYIPGCLIPEWTRNTYGIFNHAKQNNLPCITLLIGFEKAFDSISFELILALLDMFEFGENFKQWIRIILGVEENTNFSAVTVINGNISKPLSIQNGCRQGPQSLATCS